MNLPLASRIGTYRRETRETSIDVCTPATVCPGAATTGACPTSTTIVGQGSTSASDEYTCPQSDSCSKPDSAKLTDVQFCD